MRSITALLAVLAAASILSGQEPRAILRPPAQLPNAPPDGSAAPDGYAPIPAWLGQTHAPRPARAEPYSVDTVAAGLSGGFSFHFLPDGRIIVGERPGRIRLVGKDGKPSAPLGGLPLLAPLVTLSALPEILLNVLSSTPTQSSIHYHYTAGAIPGLIAGAVLGGAKLRRLRPAWWPWVGRGLVVLVLVSGILLGPLPVWRHVPFGSDLATRHHIVSAHDRAAARVIRAVPPDAAVSATNNLGAHLSERQRIFSFPVLREARWVAVDLTRPSYLDDATGKKFTAAYARFRQDERWRVVREEDGVVVLHKTAVG